MSRRRVLDPCCGGRMMWFDKNNPSAEFCDIRVVKEVMGDGRNLAVCPDVIADVTDLPYKDNTFYHVVFDPPHLRSATEKAYMVQKYGRLPREWEEFLRVGFSECMRVLKPNGTLIFKWSAVEIPVRKILEIIGFDPLYGHKSGKRQNTHWLCFIKDGEA